MSSAHALPPLKLAIPTPVQPFRPKPFLAALNSTVQQFPNLDANALIEEGTRAAGGLSAAALGGRTVPASLQFRSWVDEWLRSGRSEGDADDPNRRSFSPHGEIPEVVRKYTTQKMSLHAVGNKLNPWLPECAEMEAAASPSSLRHFWSTTDDFAAQLVLFLLSEFRFQLAQCTKCRKYFALPVRHQAYKSGTKCTTCRAGSRNDQAAKLTADSRKEAARKLHELAAKKFMKKICANPQWFRDETLTGKIVEYLNLQIQKDVHLIAIYSKPPRNGVTRKWLSWEINQTGIASRLPGIEHLA